MTLCNELNNLLNESANGFKNEFPELYKTLKRESSLDMAKDALSVTKVPTKGGDIFVIKTPEFTNYFSNKYGWVGNSDSGIDSDELGKYQDEFDRNIKKESPIKITEAQHYNTKMRAVEENMGSKRIRMGINEYKKMIENMLDTNHPSPSPVGEKDKYLLNESIALISQIIPRLRDVKESKKRVMK